MNVFFRLGGRLQNFVARTARPLTLGVRGVVFDDAGRVFLVRHSYAPGWHFPGGGVEPRETLLEALGRELREEGNIVLTGQPSLHGVFFNARLLRDHVAVFIVRAFEQTAPRRRDWEIVETGFFPQAHLPDAATPATRRRLAELAGDQPIAERW